MSSTHLLRRGLVVLFTLAQYTFQQSARAENDLTLANIRSAPSRLVAADGRPAPADVEIVRDWADSLCKLRVTNRGTAAVKLREAIVFDIRPSTANEEFV